MVWYYLAFLFILYEMLQLIAAERYIGVKQIRAGEHPLESDVPAAQWVAGCWLFGMGSYWVYILALVLSSHYSLQGLIMLLVSLFGIALRRNLGIRWALVILTIEGAIRMGLLANLLIAGVIQRGYAFRFGY